MWFLSRGQGLRYATACVRKRREESWPCCLIPAPQRYGYRDRAGRGLTTKFAKSCWRNLDDAYWWHAKKPYRANPPAAAFVLGTHYLQPQTWVSQTFRRGLSALLTGKAAVRDV